MASNKKVILVTGANSGIGYDTTRILADASPYYHIIMSARSSEKGLQAISEIQALRPAGTVTFLELDIASDASIQAAAAKLTADHGILDVLVNNAGIYGINGPGNMTRDNLHRVLDTNVFGTMLLTRALEPLLRKSEDPRIINVSSTLGSVTLRADHSSQNADVPAESYRISKAGLNMLSTIQFYQYRDWERPAKVWAYCPGYVVTNLTGEEGRKVRVDRGAESSETSAQGILEIVKGDRDGDVNKFVTRRGGLNPW